MKNSHEIIIAGSGLSGLAAAHFVKKMQPGADLLILEKDNRPGGAIQSFHDQGFLAEWGPHGFLNNTPESQELLEDTGLLAKAQLAPLGNFVRFVCHKGRLVQLPQNPKKLLSTPLLSITDKLRLVADLWIKPKIADQTIGEWAAHRFGQGVLPLVDAAVSGTFAGDFNKLSINAVMPGLRQMEIEAGSVLRGLKNKKKLSGSSPTRLPAMVSFPLGMEQLVTVLAQEKPIHFGATVTKILREADQWTIITDHATYHARKLILALPINQAIMLLTPLATPPITQVPTARIVNVVMGFSKTAKVPFGFGYLAPEREKRFTMGVMFSSHMFPGRTPPDNILIEALVGGRRHPERLDLSDDELIGQVYKDISQLIELPDKPWFVKVLRPASGIPQLEMDHPALQKWLTSLTQAHAGLLVCGFGWEGIGMNDMIKSARKVAEDTITGETTGKDAAEVKPVYF